MQSHNTTTLTVPGKMKFFCRTMGSLEENDEILSCHGGRLHRFKACGLIAPSYSDRDIISVLFSFALQNVYTMEFSVWSRVSVFSASTNLHEIEGRLALWMHKAMNDTASDSIDGQHHEIRGLNAVFSLLDARDHDSK